MASGRVDVAMFTSCAWMHEWWGWCKPVIKGGARDEDDDHTDDYTDDTNEDDVWR